MNAMTKKKCETKSKAIEYQALKDLRRELGMTLTDASAKLKIGPKGLGAIENGRVGLDKTRIEEIVSSYGLTYLDFLKKRKLIEKERKESYKACFEQFRSTKLSKNYYQRVLSVAFHEANEKNLSG